MAVGKRQRTAEDPADDALLPGDGGNDDASEEALVEVEATQDAVNAPSAPPASPPRGDEGPNQKLLPLAAYSPQHPPTGQADACASPSAIRPCLPDAGTDVTDATRYSAAGARLASADLRAI